MSQDYKNIKKTKKITSRGTRFCRRCGTHRAVIRTYGMMLCRRCFRECARNGEIGFKHLD